MLSFERERDFVIIAQLLLVSRIQSVKVYMTLNWKFLVIECELSRCSFKPRYALPIVRSRT